jgi:hypothetical protein
LDVRANLQVHGRNPIKNLTKLFEMDGNQRKAAETNRHANKGCMIDSLDGDAAATRDDLRVNLRCS